MDRSDYADRSMDGRGMEKRDASLARAPRDSSGRYTFLTTYYVLDEDGASMRFSGAIKASSWDEAAAACESMGWSLDGVIHAEIDG